MLLDFTIENWKSYADENSLNLTSSLERRHANTLSKIEGFRSLKALPVASIYGGNASGKTGIFDALSFLKDFVVFGLGVDEAIPVHPFMLDRNLAQAPCLFDITFFASGTVYRLLVEADKERIFTETLYVLKDGNREKILYDRTKNGIRFPLDSSLLFENERLAFIAEGTRPNQLFLTNAVSQNVTELKPVYEWFRDCLTLIGVSSRQRDFAAYYSRRDFIDFATEKLAELDTGIERIEGEDVDIAYIGLPPSLIKRAQKEVEESAKDIILTIVAEEAGDYAFDLFTISFEQGVPHAQRLRTYHKTPDGTSVPFGLHMESSGTRRLLELLPMLFDLCGAFEKSEKVYIVDELDRCLHTMLTARLIEMFLSTCGPATRKQLLFTSHDLLLMDQSLLRRDEMFIAQRNSAGESTLTGLSEYEGIRFDKDLIRSYLDGRFGGVPMFRPANEGGGGCI